ncbi:MAG TPA: tetratricopeptide repeat protein [Dehalococcoidia bacterium]|nr:tetratricopeptide repeat protein [Dehalococcoidia bacterium]
MVYQQEEERTKLERRLSGEAITLAIQGSWEEAVEVNRKIIETFPTDIGAYNRLGRALTELGEFAQAKEAYSKVLELAPGNVIAAKNLARLASLSEPELASNGGHHRITPALFVTEMGKAAVVNLCNLAPSKVLARMGVGAQVHLRVERWRLIVENERGEYLGEVEPQYGLRLIRLMQGGNRYAVAIRSVGRDGVQVVIREEYQHPGQLGRLSFPAKAAEHVPPRAGEPFLKAPIVAGDDEAAKEFDSSEETESDKGEEILLEGFSVLGEADEKGELEE